MEVGKIDLNTLNRNHIDSYMTKTLGFDIDIC